MWNDQEEQKGDGDSNHQGNIITRRISRSVAVYLSEIGGSGFSLLLLPTSGGSLDVFGPDISEVLPLIPVLAVAIVVTISSDDSKLRGKCV
jgi:hypothetical protein